MSRETAGVWGGEQDGLGGIAFHDVGCGCLGCRDDPDAPSNVHDVGGCGKFIDDHRVMDAARLPLLNFEAPCRVTGFKKGS